MACSKYSYVKEFENNQTILPQTYMVIRIDGKGFHKFTKKHNF
jgi:tRNA(His) guanylyltransferase